MHEVSNAFQLQLVLQLSFTFSAIFITKTTINAILRKYVAINIPYVNFQALNCSNSLFPYISFAAAKNRFVTRSKLSASKRFRKMLNEYQISSSRQYEVCLPSFLVFKIRSIKNKVREISRKNKKSNVMARFIFLIQSTVF